jgi:hypothetical protein
VVLLLAHSGVVRPREWQALLADERIALLIHCETDLELELQPYRFQSLWPRRGRT